jgi:hypothetical protein
MGAAGTEAANMAFSDNIFLPESDNQCEICGAGLSDEIVIQEFADGSIARLCSECAAGAALQPEEAEFRFPDDAAAEREGDDSKSLYDSESFDDSASFGELGTVAPRAASAPAEELDPMEKTRELLTPVVDLITLQTEMQAALQRLAASLETFATGVISENIDKTATVESRLETLERELEQTRARLRETEALLAAGGVAAAAPQPSSDQDAAHGFYTTASVAAGAVIAEAALPSADRRAAGHDVPAGAAAAAAGAGAATVWDLDSTAETPAESLLSEIEEGDETGESAGLVSESTLPPVAPVVAQVPVAPPAGPASAERHGRPGFQLAEVQLAQKYFNDSQFTNRVRDVRRSLGKPKANLTKLIGGEPRALITIAWDIIWYQYLIDLRRDIPSDERVTLHREGMDLDELTAIFKEKNSSIDDEGRLDASELEVKLLSDPSTLITEMSVEDERALEDATEEIWDQKTAPEFKWDS